MVREATEDPKTTQATSMPFDYPPDLDYQTVLLKTPWVPAV